MLDLYRWDAGHFLRQVTWNGFDLKIILQMRINYSSLYSPATPVLNYLDILRARGGFPV